MNWDEGFESPFKSDVYFFSTRLRLDQRWGTATPITIRDKEFGAVRLRGYGIYSYRITDPKLLYTNVSGARETYYVSDLEGQLRNTVVAKRIPSSFLLERMTWPGLAACGRIPRRAPTRREPASTSARDTLRSAAP